MITSIENDNSANARNRNLNSLVVVMNGDRPMYFDECGGSPRTQAIILRSREMIARSMVIKKMRPSSSSDAHLRSTRAVALVMISWLMFFKCGLRSSASSRWL